MDALAGWLRQIVAVVLLAAIVDLLLPNRTMQRYVRLVAGLFILLTVATPVLQWLRGDFSSRLAAGLKAVEITPRGAAAELSRIEEGGRRLRERRQAEAADLLAVRLEDNILKDLADGQQLPVKQVEAAVEPAADGSLQVLLVRVTLAPPESMPVSGGDDGAEAEAEAGFSRPPASVDSVAPVTVEPVDISRQDNLEASVTDRTTALRIAAYIAGRYGIPAERVQVEQIKA